MHHFKNLLVGLVAVSVIGCQPSPAAPATDPDMPPPATKVSVDVYPCTYQQQAQENPTVNAALQKSLSDIGIKDTKVFAITWREVCNSTTASTVNPRLSGADLALVIPVKSLSDVTDLAAITRKIIFLLDHTPPDFDGFGLTTQLYLTFKADNKRLASKFSFAKSKDARDQRSSDSDFLKALGYQVN